jgi:hypothetical protein
LAIVAAQAKKNAANFLVAASDAAGKKFRE